MAETPQVTRPRTTANGLAAVDVILPTKGRTHTIGFAIRSVLAQTHRDLRLHVVADGCDVERAVRDAAGDDPRVDYASFPKAPGFGYANRNAALRRTSAPFVAYISDDDLWFGDHLEVALGELLRRGLDLVAFRSVHAGPDGELDPHFFAYEWRFRLGSRPIRDWFVGSSNLVHRRAMFARIGDWNERLPRFGDRELYQRALDSRHAEFVDLATSLRFYALHWDRLYARRPQPPQDRYVQLVSDPGWISDARARARSPARGAAARVRQAKDFLRFALRSGPRWIRHVVRTLTADRARP